LRKLGFLVTICQAACVAQTYWGHDLQFLRSRDVISDQSRDNSIHHAISY